MHSPDPTAQIKPEAVSRLHLNLNDPQMQTSWVFYYFQKQKSTKWERSKLDFLLHIITSHIKIKMKHTIPHSYISH
jgi:hypothetical protein